MGRRAACQAKRSISVTAESSAGRVEREINALLHRASLRRRRSPSNCGRPTDKIIGAICVPGWRSVAFHRFPLTSGLATFRSVATILVEFPTREVSIETLGETNWNAKHVKIVSDSNSILIDSGPGRSPMPTACCPGPALALVAQKHAGADTMQLLQCPPVCGIASACAVWSVLCQPVRSVSIRVTQDFCSV